MCPWFCVLLVPGFCPGTHCRADSARSRLFLVLGGTGIPARDSRRSERESRDADVASPAGMSVPLKTVEDEAAAEPRTSVRTGAAARHEDGVLGVAPPRSDDDRPPRRTSRDDGFDLGLAQKRVDGVGVGGCETRRVVLAEPGERSAAMPRLLRTAPSPPDCPDLHDTTCPFEEPAGRRIRTHRESPSVARNSRPRLRP